jgi:hypothetical protein
MAFPIDTERGGSYTGGMEVHFTPDEQDELLKIAKHEGIDAEKLMKDAALRLIEDDARFREGVRKGIEQADSGQLIEEEEMDLRVKRMFEAFASH